MRPQKRSRAGDEDPSSSSFVVDVGGGLELEMEEGVLVVPPERGANAARRTFPSPPPPPPPPPPAPAIDEHATVESIARSVRVTKREADAMEASIQGTLAWYVARRGLNAYLPEFDKLLAEIMLLEVDDDVVKQFLERYAPEVAIPASFEGRRARLLDLCRTMDPRSEGAEGWLSRLSQSLGSRLTGSVVGAAVGHSMYQSPEDLMIDMIWGTTRSNEAMRYGSITEDVACEIYEQAMTLLTGGRIQIEHRGLMMASRRLECGRDPETGEPTYEGWCGVSPDGIAKIVGADGKTVVAERLIEIKCPFYSQRNFYSDRAKYAKLGIAEYYYDQIQAIMGLVELSRTDFVVHLPDRTQILGYTYNSEYFEDLFAKMRDFWFNRYLPVAVMRARGMLRRGMLETVDCEALDALDAEIERSVRAELDAIRVGIAE